MSPRARWAPWKRLRRNPRDWPLAAKITALSAGACALVALALATLGYYQAVDGVEHTAQGALRSDAQLVTQAVEMWHTARIVNLRIIAANESIIRFLSPGADLDEMKASVQEVLDSHAEYASDVDSIALLDSTGTILASSNRVDVGQNVSQRDYFTVASSGNAFTSGISVSTITNEPAIFHSAPVKSAAGRVIGVVRSRASLREMTSIVLGAKGRAGDGAVGILLDDSGLVIASSDSMNDWFLHPVVPLPANILEGMVRDRRWGTQAPPEPLGLVDLRPAIKADRSFSFDWTVMGAGYDALVVPINMPHWSYVAALPVETINASARSFLRNAIFVALIVLIEVTILTALLARGITRRVRTVTDGAQQIARQDLPALVAVARALAAGDLTVRPTMTTEPVPVQGEDEIGQLGHAFNQMVGELKATEAAFAETSTNLRCLVGRILESSVRLAGTAELLGSSTSQASMTVEQVARAVQQVAVGAQDQAMGAQESREAVNQLRTVIDQVARGAEDQAISVSTASRNAEQMAAAAEQAAASAHTVVAASQQSHVAAAQGGRAVAATVDGMAQIRDVVIRATEKVEELGRLGVEIGSVVEIIDEIAERTNLLALNAAIEAARAGEHGRGFAVVADEVKNLAERSQNETKTIAQMIREIQEGTRDAVAAMERGSRQVLEGSDRADEAGRALDEILDAAEQAARQVGEIADTAQELAAYSHEVRGAIASISIVVEEASAASEEMAASAESAGRAIGGIAAVAEEHSAVAEEVSASAVQVSAQVDEMSARAQELAATAEQLRNLVAGFRLDASPLRRQRAAATSPNASTPPPPSAPLVRAGR